MNGAVEIAGAGLCTRLGRSLRETWDGLKRGVSVLGPQPASGSAVPHWSARVHQVPGVPGPPRKQAVFDAAARDCLRQAGLEGFPEGAAWIIAGQAALPPLDVADENSLFTPPDVARWTRNEPILLSHACASAVFGMNLAVRLIEAGGARDVVVAGATMSNEPELRSLQVTKALGARVSRPFDTRRDGISLGEGAGVVLLRRLTRDPTGPRSKRPVLVRAVKTRITGGLGADSDPDQILSCMSDTLDDAGSGAVSYVHAHATGTQQGDLAELRAVEELVAGRRMPDLPVSSHKGAIGHLLHASGLVGTAVGMKSVIEGVAPPNIGLERAEETHGVVLVDGVTPLRKDGIVLVNALGFGGNLACLALGSA